MFKIFFFLTESNDQYWLCVDTQNYKCNCTSPIDNSSGVMSCSISSDDNCQNTKHMCCAITHNDQYWLCVCTHQNCKCNCTTFIADCSKDMMSCSISSDNNCQINNHTHCAITLPNHQWVCDMDPLSQTCTATKSKNLDHIQVDVTTISPESYTITTLIKTSATISYNSSHLSSLSQTTTSSIYSSTLPIVVASSTSTIIVISVTAVLIALVILLTSLLLPIIVLRRYGQFKPGR